MCKFEDQVWTRSAVSSTHLWSTLHRIRKNSSRIELENAGLNLGPNTVDVGEKKKKSLLPPECLSL